MPVTDLQPGRSHTAVAGVIQQNCAPYQSWAQIKMHYRATFAVLLCTAIPALAACPKPVAGPTMNWAGVVCEGRNETDDFFSPSVQGCLKSLVAKDRIPSAPAEVCSLNTKYKLDLCEGMVKLQAKKSTQA